MGCTASNDTQPANSGALAGRKGSRGTLNQSCRTAGASRHGSPPGEDMGSISSLEERLFAELETRTVSVSGSAMEPSEDKRTARIAAVVQRGKTSYGIDEDPAQFESTMERPEFKKKDKRRVSDWLAAVTLHPDPISAESKGDDDDDDDDGNLLALPQICMTCADADASSVLSQPSLTHQPQHQQLSAATTAGDAPPGLVEMQASVATHSDTTPNASHNEPIDGSGVRASDSVAGRRGGCGSTPTLLEGQAGQGNGGEDQQQQPQQQQQQQSSTRRSPRTVMALHGLGVTETKRAAFSYSDVGDVVAGGGNTAERSPPEESSINPAGFPRQHSNLSAHNAPAMLPSAGNSETDPLSASRVDATLPGAPQ